MDSLEFDIKRALTTSPGAQLQWHRIKDELLEKYNTIYEESTFKTSLHRKLQKLRLAGDINKKVLGHQEVFYFIPKKRLRKIREELDRELAHRTFDDIWQSFSPEQRKRELQNLLRDRFQVIGILQNITKELSSFAEEQTKERISRLENPTEHIEAEYSPEEQKKLLNESYKMQKELEKIQSEMTRDCQPLSEEAFRELLRVTQEFMDKVVPKYYGGWREAIQDLMRKAIEEQKGVKEEKEKKVISHE